MVTDSLPPWPARYFRVPSLQPLLLETVRRRHICLCFFCPVLGSLHLTHGYYSHFSVYLFLSVLCSFYPERHQVQSNVLFPTYSHFLGSLIWSHGLRCNFYPDYPNWYLQSDMLQQVQILNSPSAKNSRVTLDHSPYCKSYWCHQILQFSSFQQPPLVPAKTVLPGLLQQSPKWISLLMFLALLPKSITQNIHLIHYSDTKRELIFTAFLPKCQSQLKLD